MTENVNYGDIVNDTREDMGKGRQAKKRKDERGEKKLVKIIVGVTVLALIGVCTWQFIEVQRLRNPDHAAQEAKQEAQKLKEKVGRLMQLPDEDVTVATVQDISKLSEQEFFESAQDGDKVLIFTGAKKAVIYRESENKIINSGPIVLNSSNMRVVEDDK